MRALVSEVRNLSQPVSGISQNAKGQADLRFSKGPRSETSGAFCVLEGQIDLSRSLLSMLWEGAAERTQKKPLSSFAVITVQLRGAVLIEML
ncbi:hypothetical protein D9M68_921470 [compost metagenome]